MGIKRPQCRMFAPFTPTRIARDCSYYTSAVLSEKEALQELARYEVQKNAWAEICSNDGDRAETVWNVSSRQELERS